MSAEQIDSVYLVETPEGIDLQAVTAGPVPRALAYAIDLTIRALVISIAAIIVTTTIDGGIGIILVLSFLLEWFYPVLFEIFNHGQTPGKRQMGLVVVNDDLTPVTLAPSLIRNLLRAADFMPFSYLGGLLCMVSNARFQRLGDLAAGTVVIYRPQQRESTGVPEVRTCPPPQALDIEDQVAIIGFTERAATLSHERQQELAEILEPVTRRRGRAGIDYLRGIGNWLLGVR